MKIAVIGTGYVGLVSAACFAQLGHTVTGVDIDAAKIGMLRKGKSPIYEPELEDVIKRGLESGLLSFTTDLLTVLPDVEIVFSAVATPTGEGFKADLRAVFTVAETVARHATKDLLFVNKSTVPVGTGKKCEEKIAAILKERGITIRIPVISNPEFLREGLAVSDTLAPDRIIVGINGEVSSQKLTVKNQMEELYRPITRIGRPILFMSRESAEIVKYASNAFLATKISFINMLTAFTEKTGANIRDVAAGLGLDNRIGPKFLHAGLGYGGSCFPKDVKAFLETAREIGVELPIVEATDKVNTRQRFRFFEKVLAALPPKATVSLWGLSFKPRTDDMREAPSLDFIPLLLKAGHRVTAYDPAAMENTKKFFPSTEPALSSDEGLGTSGTEITYASSPLEAATGAHAIVVLTEWDIFRGIDLKEVRTVMKGDLLFDGRNIYEPKEVAEAGLTYEGIGIGKFSL